MSYSDLEDIVYNEFDDNYSETDVFFPNTDQKTEGKKEWIRPIINESIPFQSCAGRLNGVHTRSEGIIFIQCFSENGDGTRAREIIEAVKTTIQYKQISGLYTQAAQVIHIGTEVNGYWQNNIIVPYFYDYIVT